jgi:sec-independent protein translocase protein TatA
MFGLGSTELIIIAIIVFLLFGARRLPEIGKGLGGAIREFRNIKKDLNPDETDDRGPGRDDAPKKNGAPASLEEKIVDKVVEQVPGAKEAIAVKKKADKIKKFIK